MRNAFIARRNNPKATQQTMKTFKIKIRVLEDVRFEVPLRRKPRAWRGTQARNWLSLRDLALAQRTRSCKHHVD